MWKLKFFLLSSFLTLILSNILKWMRGCREKREQANINRLSLAWRRCQKVKTRGEKGSWALKLMWKLKFFLLLSFLASGSSRISKEDPNVTAVMENLQTTTTVPTPKVRPWSVMEFTVHIIAKKNTCEKCYQEVSEDEKSPKSWFWKYLNDVHFYTYFL